MSSTSFDVCLQDPVVFSGTVRDNLDPFNACESDAAIWSALRQTGMADTVTKLQVCLSSLHAWQHQPPDPLACNALEDVAYSFTSRGLKPLALEASQRSLALQYAYGFDSVTHGATQRVSVAKASTVMTSADDMTAPDADAAFACTGWLGFSAG